MTAPEAERPKAPSRRDVLRYAGAAGTVAAGVTVAQAAGWPASRVDRAAAGVGGVLDLHINEGFVPMVDGSLVYLRGFGEKATTINDPFPSLTISPRIFFADGRLVDSRLFPPDAAPPHEGRPEPDSAVAGDPLVYLVKRSYWGSYFPRRTIVAESGSTIRLRVHNGLKQPHSLLFHGVPGGDSGEIASGAVQDLEFPAPPPGTYVYSDPGGISVQRTLGLFGVLVVVPQQDHWRLSELGAEFERQWLWIAHDIDPVWSRRALAGETIDPVSTPALPRYFTLNDRAGFQSVGVTQDEAINLATHEETLVSGSPRRTDVRDFSQAATATTVITGQLIRLVNAGVVIHQMHFHGNHVWTLRRDGVDFSRSVGTINEEGHVLLQQWEDVVELDPLSRKDIILPLKPPPDALDEVFAARTVDWHYPMHCHAEPSQTAAGGLYPGGAVADWVLALPKSAGGTP
jgi:FtsP/CotA-like multicopper oxidase with cupredoxin domain